MRKETDYAVMWISDGIFYLTFKTVPDLNLKIAKMIVADRLLYQHEKVYPMIWDLRKIHHISDDAMAFFASEGTAMLKVLAIVVHTPYEHYLGEIFIQFHHPQIPTKLCFTKHEALSFIVDDR